MIQNPGSLRISVEFQQSVMILGAMSPALCFILASSTSAQESPRKF